MKKALLALATLLMSGCYPPSDLPPMPGYDGAGSCLTDCGIKAQVRDEAHCHQLMVTEKHIIQVFAERIEGWDAATTCAAFEGWTLVKYAPGGHWDELGFEAYAARSEKPNVWGWTEPEDRSFVVFGHTFYGPEYNQIKAYDINQSEVLLRSDDWSMDSVLGHELGHVLLSGMFAGDHHQWMADHGVDAAAAEAARRARQELGIESPAASVSRASALDRID